MREHLFRGKRLSRALWPGDKVWVEGSLIDSGNHEQVVIFPYQNCASSLSVMDIVRIFAVQVDAETVGEWTGFVDHHGKKIFEGDYVWFNSGYDLTAFVIVWENGAWGTRYADGRDDDTDPMDALFAENCEVCGNIHDMPEFKEE